MNEQAQEEISENIEVVTPGILLQEARVNAQLTVNDIAKKLNLKSGLIDAIEANEFEEISSPIFARGYLKAYAKLLHLSEQDVLEAYDHLASAELQQSQMQSFSHRSSQKAADNWLSIVSLLLLVSIIAGVVVWYFQQNPTETVQTDSGQSTTTQTPSAQVRSSDNQDASSKADSSQVSNTQAVSSSQGDGELAAGQNDNLSPAGEILASDEELANNDVSANESDTQANDAQPTSTAPDIQQESQQLVSSPISPQQERLSATSQPVSAQVHTATSQTVAQSQLDSQPKLEANLSHLELRFSDSCWINIEDATGERVAIGTKVKGHYTSVHGVAPFTIKLGKPDAVTIWLAGEQKQIPYYPKGSIANFELSLN